MKKKFQKTRETRDEHNHKCRIYASYYCTTVNKKKESKNHKKLSSCFDEIYSLSLYNQEAIRKNGYFLVKIGKEQKIS
jgi:hypothetical protein